MRFPRSFQTKHRSSGVGRWRYPARAFCGLLRGRASGRARSASAVWRNRHLCLSAKPPG